MLWKATVFVLALFLLKSFLSYRDWLNWQTKSVLRVAPGPCTVVIESGGSEYLTHIGNGKILLTSGLFDLFDTEGSLKIIDLQENNKVTTLNITSAPVGKNLLPSPHGMSVWRDPDTGELLVYVLTHTSNEDRVAVFELLPSLDLKYLKTITDPMFVYMNDLVVVGKDQFYITSYYLYRTKLLIAVEIFARLHFGKILYYDGSRAREVASGYLMPNGLNLSPDKRFVYMAECGNKKLHGYRRLLSGDLEQVWEHQLDSCVDNIEVDPDTGDIWAGAHPLFWRIVDVYNTLNLTPASQVLRIKMRNNTVDSVEQIYADDGGELSGTTSASLVNGKLAIGTVAAQTAVCDVKYLSP